MVVVLFLRSLLRLLLLLSRWLFCFVIVVACVFPILMLWLLLLLFNYVDGVVVPEITVVIFFRSVLFLMCRLFF